MNTQEALLHALHLSPGDLTGWLALADWLEEQGQDDRAELLRLDLALRQAPVGDRPRHAQDRIVELLRAGVRPLLPTLELPRGVEMVLVPPGQFLMGSPREEDKRYEEEGPQHLVTLTRPFYLSATLVTQAQYKAVLGASPSHFKGDDLPVENIAWSDANRFCKALSAECGRAVRLPTEAQWEHACRANTETAFFWGDTLASDLANYHAQYVYRSGQKGPHRNETTPVRAYPPNVWGLYDLHGNVLQWCRDRAVRWTGEPRVDPVILRGRGHRGVNMRVPRGGSWGRYPWNCRSAMRYGYAPRTRYDFIGFRVAMRWERPGTRVARARPAP
jgi:uncharacterized protein (TIGR02996 family)